MTFTQIDHFAAAPLVGVTGGEVGQLLVALVALAVIVFVGRTVLHVAWRLVTIALLVVAVLYVATLFAPGVLPA